MHIQDMGRHLAAPLEFMNEVNVRIGVLSVPEQATKTTGGGGGGSAVSVEREQATKTTGGAVSVREQAWLPEQVTKTTGGGGGSAVSVPEQVTKAKGGGGSAVSVREQATKTKGGGFVLTDAQVTQMNEKWIRVQSENENLQRQIEKLKSEKEKLESEKEKLQQQCADIAEFYEQMSAGAAGQCFP